MKYRIRKYKATWAGKRRAGKERGEREGDSTIWWKGKAGRKINGRKEKADEKEARPAAGTPPAVTH